jgi:hypothetical protein
VTPSRLSRLMVPGGAPEHWDFTLLPFASLIRRLLDAVDARSVVEVGADRGDFTRELRDWAGRSGARITAIEPNPASELVALCEGNPDVELVREPSPAALDALPAAQAVILDGDHNYYTLSAELRLLAERPSDQPLLLLHDLGWPHARRDTYYEPGRIPEDFRQPLARDALIAPGEPGSASAGIRFGWAAAREGGPRNGVLTAVEDFLNEDPDLRLEVVPAFFGLGVLWPQDAGWAPAVEEIIMPWASNPMLTRLEEVRLASIVDRTRLNRQEELLRTMLNSGSFTVAERISRLRPGTSEPLSRERIRRVLGD